MSPPRADADGSRERPFRRVAAALARAQRGDVVSLAVGLYPGVVTVPPGVGLEGPRTAVLYAEAGQVAVELSPGAWLHGVSVQGGDVGVSVMHGDVAMDDVHFSGQRRAALELKTGVRAQLRDVDVEGTVSETTGLLIDGAAAELSGCRFRGALRTGIELRRAARLTSFKGRFDGPVTAIKAERSGVFVHDLEISGGRGPAIWLSGGDARLRQVTIYGHEYGVLANDGLTLRVDGFTSVRAERTAMGLFEVKASLSHVTVLDSGSYGGLQLINSDTTLHHFLVARAKEYGISVIRGRATMEQGVVLDTVDGSGHDGDGITARESQVKVSSVTVLRSGGSAIVATQRGQLALVDAQLDDSKAGGLLAEDGGRLEAQSVIITRSGATALVIPDDATLRADVLHTRGSAEGLLWVECARGGEAELGRIFGKELHLGTRGPCVGSWKTPRLFNPLGSPALPTTP